MRQREMWSTKSRFLSRVKYSSARPSAISTRASKKTGVWIKGMRKCNPGS